MILENFLRRLLRLYLQSTFEKHPLLQETLTRIATRASSSFSFSWPKSTADTPSLPMRAVVSSILPGRLYLSGITAASSAPTLAEYGFTHVLSIVTAEEAPRMPAGITHQIIPISDTSTTDILSRLPEVVAFINSAFGESEDSKVLVHCVEGVSRSASAVIAYLMAERGMTFGQALRIVKRRRSIVCPNLGFVRQLSEWGSICEAKRMEQPKEWEQVLRRSTGARSESSPPPVRVEKVEKRNWMAWVFGRNAMS
ncbi:protein-tyrosine phosphatase-like protein [Tricharina praecox]|uniref:protein-tyrosine phosphatase-like protein n=1 Tax=Tricharina praecox TaxID=43433 RepID=UPI00221E8490|nr:protein-tyrosine phosphatase-like protein [Tricharina praecox]KAI5859177.1 protein-tyrosine phosphatase-like protein [Tricharina praecox]